MVDVFTPQDEELNPDGTAKDVAGQEKPGQKRKSHWDESGDSTTKGGKTPTTLGCHICSSNCKHSAVRDPAENPIYRCCMWHPHTTVEAGSSDELIIGTQILFPDQM